jgi:hypothetical protein
VEATELIVRQKATVHELIQRPQEVIHLKPIQRLLAVIAQDLILLLQEAVLQAEVTLLLQEVQVLRVVLAHQEALHPLQEEA